MSIFNNREVEIFSEAVKLPSGERRTFLLRACGGDEELRRQVEGLLRANDTAGEFLRESPHGLEPEVRAAMRVGEKPGDCIGRYKLVRQIGEGGGGVVFLAQQEEPIRRSVALKIIKPGMDTRSVIARFEAERQTLALMDHPNIAKVFDAGATQSGRPYFVMELIRGMKITEYCDQNSLPVGERLRLLVLVCQAVQHAHQKGIIHRDLKPSNILVTTNQQGAGVPMIIDFGIAKATSSDGVGDKTVATVLGMMMGTPAYMSPEQTALTSVDVDTRTDIYSLGVLLYELLTGYTPFDGKELLKLGYDEIRRIIREQEPPCPSVRLNRIEAVDRERVAGQRQLEPAGLIRLVRGDLEGIVLKAMEKERGRRYETANGLALDIQRFLAGEPVLARTPSAFYRFQKTVLRHKLLFLGLGIITALVLVSLVGVSILWGREREARREAAGALLQAQADKQRAEGEAAKSRQVKKLLEDMLQNVGPSVAWGQDTTMLKGILDRTAERVGLELTNQPDLEVEMRSVMGRVYYELGDYPQAEEMQKQELAINRKLHGPQSQEVAATLNALGLTCWREGKQAEAETNDLEALAVWRQQVGEEHPAVAASLNNLADVYRHYHRPQDAERLAREALGIRERVFGTNSLEVADSLRVLSIAMGDEGRWEDAERLARQVLEIRRTRLKPEDPLVAASLMDLAWIAGARGRLDEAESLEGEVLVLRQKVLGNNHPDVAKSFYMLGEYMRQRGKLDQAYSVLTSALNIQRKALTQDNPAMLDTIHSLGQVLEAQSKLAEAEKMYREELAAWRQANGDAASKTVSALEGLVGVLVKERQFGEAEEMLNDVVTPALAKQSGFAELVFQRAGLEARAGKWDAAADDASVAVANRSAGESHFSFVGAILLKTHRLAAYGQFREKIIAGYAGATNQFVADQVAKACLLAAPAEKDLKTISGLADSALKNGAGDSGALPFFQVCKALAEYRRGHFGEAVEWATKSAGSERTEAREHAFGVLAMANWRLGHFDEARAMLAKGEALAPVAMPREVAEDPGDGWRAWLFARITLEEARGLMPVASNEAGPGSQKK